LIRETKNTPSVGVPPGTGLGNTALLNANKDSFKTIPYSLRNYYLNASIT